MLGSLKEKGVFIVLLLRFEKYTLPRAIDLKEKVARGEKLEDFDIAFLNKAISNIQRYKTLIDKNPEFHQLEARAIWLYTQIIELALKNENIK
ncbi:MAG: hypothetical protein KZQ83_16540 [gamma proteobacterium symbiont of Taylorina sp.]|nr:hypothetical protein [gamma proteobacterium symbiont of Taylorina sp.]